MPTPQPADDPAGTAPAEQVGRRRRRRRRLLVALLAVTGLVVAAVVAATSYVATVSNSVADNLQHGPALPPEVPDKPGQAPRPTKAAVAGQAVNYVLMGSDVRPEDSGAGRSDVVMVLHLSANRKSAALISFPRDLYVPIPGHGKDKINAAYAYGGPQLTVRTLEGLLGTRMDHTAVIDFDGFMRLTDQLGGVTIDNPHASVSEGTDSDGLHHRYTFPVGRITISGSEALAYVRERKQLPEGDLDRAERQRLVAKAVLAKGLSRQTLLDPRAFNRFAAGLAAQVSVDDGLSVSELRRTALSVRVDPDHIASLQAPISGYGTSPSGQSIDVLDRARLKELAAALRNDTLPAYERAHP